jgi:hypothetical protein
MELGVGQRYSSEVPSRPYQNPARHRDDDKVGNDEAGRVRIRNRSRGEDRFGCRARLRVSGVRPSPPPPGTPPPAPPRRWLLLRERLHVRLSFAR